MRIPIRPIRWSEWYGYNLPTGSHSFCYFTYGHADMSFGPQRSELAKTLKTDGVVDDFSEALRRIDESVTIHGMAYVESEGELPTFYMEDNYEGVGALEPATWVVFPWE